MNRNFIPVLCHWRAREESAHGNPPLATFLEYTSLVQQNMKIMERKAATRIAFKTLSIITEDHFANCFLHDQSVKVGKIRVANLLSCQLRFFERALSSAQLFLKVTQLSSAFWIGLPAQLSSARFVHSSARLSYFFFLICSYRTAYRQKF